MEQQQQQQQKVRPVSDARKQSCVFLWRMWAYSEAYRHFRILMLSQQGVLPAVCLGIMYVLFEGCIGSCWGNRRGGDHWRDLGVDGWIIL